MPSVHKEFQAAIDEAEVSAFLGAADFLRERGQEDLADDLIAHFLERADA